jgi:homoserine kinase
MNQFKITVPASSANMGPGFDSAGLAVNRFLTIYVKRQEEWSFEHHGHFLPVITDYKEHLIYQIAKKTAERYGVTLPACHVIVESEIPLARGLGSSSSAVLAGIELANQVCNLSLTKAQKLQFGTEIEGHPDNIAPALFGGVIVTTMTPSGGVEYATLPELDLDVIVYIPTVELKTEAARGVLPENFSRKDTTTASGISNVMIASLLTGDYELAGSMMERDIFHEPYRAELIPNYETIKQVAKKAGAYGTVISGAGTTMISFVPKEKTAAITAHMAAQFPNHDVAMLEIDKNGLQVEKV